MIKLSNRRPPSARRRRSGHGPAPTRTSQVRATVLNGWDVQPTLGRANAHRRSLAQAAGSFVAGSPRPQALIQCRQQLADDELRLGTLVILSRSAPQPVPDDSAVAQLTMASPLDSSALQN